MNGADAGRPPPRIGIDYIDYIDKIHTNWRGTVFFLPLHMTLTPPFPAFSVIPVKVKPMKTLPASASPAELPVETSAPDTRTKPLPTFTQLKEGGAMQTHQKIHHNLTGNAAMMLQLREQVAQNEKAKAKLPSAGLLVGTAATLFGEAGLHYSNATNRAPWRTAIGAAQKNIGLVGAAYYGSKLTDNPTSSSFAMALGYALFNGEGFLRMLKAEHPHLPEASTFGAGAAFSKAMGAQTWWCRLAYVADVLANAIEARHGTDRPKEKGFARAMWNLSHSMKREQIASIQIGAGAGMLADAFGKLYKYASTKPAGGPAQGSTQEASVFDARLDNFFAGLAQGDAALEQNLDRICGLPTPEQCEEEFCKLLDAYAKQKAAA